MSGAIHVHIGELVLHGFDPRDRLRIGEAVESELARLFAAAPPAAESLRAHPPRMRLDAGEVAIGSVRGPQAGALVARTVHARLAR